MCARHTHRYTYLGRRRRRRRRHRRRRRRCRCRRSYSYSSRCAHTRARVSSLRNAALAPPHPRSLAPRSRLLPRAVWACFLCAVFTFRYDVHHCLLRRLCLLLVAVITCRHVRHCLLHRRHPYQATNPSGLWSAFVITAVSSRDGRAPSTRRPILPGSGLPGSSPPSLTGVPLYQAASPSGLWSALVITAVSDGRAYLPRGRRFP